MEDDDATAHPPPPLSPLPPPTAASHPAAATKRKSSLISQPPVPAPAHPSEPHSITAFHSPLPPSAPPSAPSRFLFPQPSYDAQLDGPTLLLPASTSPSLPHDLLERHYAVLGSDGRCRLTVLDAFFLSYALPVLRVTGEDGDMISAQQLLVRVCEAERRFLSLFAAYAHWTALGWVVRPGSKMGVDFLLYPHHHLHVRTHSTSADSRAQRGVRCSRRRRDRQLTPVLSVCCCGSLCSATPSKCWTRGAMTVCRLLCPGMPSSASSGRSRRSGPVSTETAASREASHMKAGGWTSVCRSTSHCLSPFHCPLLQRLLVCSTSVPAMSGEEEDGERLWAALPPCHVSSVSVVSQGLQARMEKTGGGVETGSASDGSKRSRMKAPRSRAADGSPSSSVLSA